MNALANTRPSLLIRLRDPQDDRAWVEFLEVYKPVVYRFARRKGFQDADAEELTQEVFIAVRSAVDRWDHDPSRGKFRSWLFRIVRNRMINLAAAQQRQPKATGGTDMRILLEQQPAPVAEDSALFNREYKRQAFHWAAERICGEFRDTTWRAFWMTAVEGGRIKEVAKLLGVTVGAVYKSRSRVMARLRRTVELLEDE